MRRKTARAANGADATRDGAIPSAASAARGRPAPLTTGGAPRPPRRGCAWSGTRTPQQCICARRVGRVRAGAVAMGCGPLAHSGGTLFRRGRQARALGARDRRSTWSKRCRTSLPTRMWRARSGPRSAAAASGRPVCRGSRLLEQGGAAIATASALTLRARADVRRAAMRASSCEGPLPDCMRCRGSLHASSVVRAVGGA